MSALFKVDEFGEISTCNELLDSDTRNEVYSDTGKYRAHKGLYDSLVQACASSVVLMCPGGIWGSGAVTKVKDQTGKERCFVSTVAHLFYDKSEEGSSQRRPPHFLCGVYKETSVASAPGSVFGVDASVGRASPLVRVGTGSRDKLIELKNTPGDYRDEAIFEMNSNFCNAFPELPTFTLDELKRENTPGRQCAEVQTPVVFGVKYLSLSWAEARSGSLNVLGKSYSESKTHRMIDSLAAEYMSGSLSGELCGNKYVPKTLISGAVDGTEDRVCAGNIRGVPANQGGLVICHPDDIAQIGMSLGHALELYLKNSVE
ncbi:hypothetical protein [Hyphomonas sp.]|uniref:hypothetical protein n=1 Tax=Hyphomonas sp. TaxID=87 RepID=UPI00391B75D1